jgi:hypothetical protein
MTIGIVRVAFFAAWTAGVNSATITPTSRRTSSNASVQLQLGARLSGERSEWRVIGPYTTGARRFNVSSAECTQGNSLTTKSRLSGSSIQGVM